MNEMKKGEPVIQDAVEETFTQSCENSNSTVVPSDEISSSISTVENCQHDAVTSEMTPTAAGQTESSKELIVNQTNQLESMKPTAAGQSYKDFSGIDTESFIVTALRNQPKDRPFILYLEKLFREFIGDDQQIVYQCQPMNSYERMIAHRVAAYFGLNHNVDRSGHAIIVSKTSVTRIPDLSFKSFISKNDSMDGAPTPGTLTTKITSNHPQENHSKPRAKISSSLNSITDQSQVKETRPMIARVQRKQLRPMATTERPLATYYPESPSHSLIDQHQPRMFSPRMLPASSHQQRFNNFAPLIASNPSPSLSNISFAPILVQQPSNSSIQYGYTVPPSVQIAIPAASSQYSQVPPPNFITLPPVYRNSTQFVHTYPSSIMNPYFHTVSANSITHVDYATQQMAMLNLQNTNGHGTRLPLNQPIHYLGQSLVQSPTNGGFVPFMSSHPNLPDKTKFVNSMESKSTTSNRQVDVLQPTK